MAHYRTTVRNAIADALATISQCEGRVFRGRVAPLQSDELPAIIVRTVSEDVAQDGSRSAMGSPVYERSLSVEVVIYVVGNEQDDAQAIGDAIALECETRIAAAYPTAPVDLESEVSESDLQGDLPLLVHVQTYRVTYAAPRGNPAGAE